jgi:C-5 cytosine-specific DNA methylase
VKPLCIDLFCGLGGWAEGFLSEGYDVIGFDIEKHEYGDQKYPGQLVIQDVLTLDGSQFRNARIIVASPPCQAYSYRAMPWSRARALPPPDNSLFDACFRIQREASEAAGRYVPLVVENVRGAQRWVGRARWHFGSFFLWGDLPALMPIGTHRKVPKFRFDGSGKSFQLESVKVSGLDWSGFGKPGYKAQGFNVTAAQRVRQNPPFGWQGSIMQKGSSRSDSRKAASAMIAKIPFPLSSHIARCFK